MPIPPRPISPRIRYLPATRVPGRSPRSRESMVEVREGAPSADGSGEAGGAAAPEGGSAGWRSGAAQVPQNREDSGFAARHFGQSNSFLPLMTTIIPIGTPVNAEKLTNSPVGP